MQWHHFIPIRGECVASEVKTIKKNMFIVSCLSEFCRSVTVGSTLKGLAYGVGVTAAFTLAWCSRLTKILYSSAAYPLPPSPPGFITVKIRVIAIDGTAQARFPHVPKFQSFWIPIIHLRVETPLCFARPRVKTCISARRSDTLSQSFYKII